MQEQIELESYEDDASSCSEVNSEGDKNIVATIDKDISSVVFRSQARGSPL